MQVQLLRAWPKRADSMLVEVNENACVADALAAANWQLDTEFVAIAVFGVAAQADTRPHPGDRIELLRALLIDPKQARRLRAERAKRR